MGEPESETIVWVAPSWFIHVTTVPVFTVSEEGSNAKLLIVMEMPPPVDAGGAVVVAGAGPVWEEEQPAAMQARMSRAIQAEQSTKREGAGILP